ncbi:hypothetical protein LINPERHAP1_LOCUS35807 [Linum perenne]
MATLNPCRRRRYHPLFFLGPLLARRNGKEKASSHLRQWGRISEPTRSVGRHGGATEGRRGYSGVSTAAGRRHAKEDGGDGEERGLDGDPVRRRGGGGEKRRNQTQRRRRGIDVVMASAAKEEQKRRSSSKKDESTRVITLKIR